MFSRLGDGKKALKDQPGEIKLPQELNIRGCDADFDNANTAGRHNAETMSDLLQASLLLVSFVSGGFKCLHAALHVPLKHFPILTLLLSQRHEVAAVVGLILRTHNHTHINHMINT